MKLSFKTFCACLALLYVGDAMAVQEITTSCSKNKGKQRSEIKASNTEEKATTNECMCAYEGNEALQKIRELEEQLNDLRKIQENKPIELSWKDYKRRQVIITDKELDLTTDDISYIYKLGEVSFPNLKNLTITETTGMGALSDDQLKTFLKKLENSPNLNILCFWEGSLTELPPEIGNLTNLQVLMLQHNELTKLPPEIVNLTNLKMLDLDDNQFTKFPSEILKLKNLEDLGLYSSLLRELPPEIVNLTNLKELNLGSNRLKELPPGIENLKNLENLYLSYNRLTKFPEEILNLKNLVSLNIGGNGLKELPSGIVNLTNLEELGLEYNKFTKFPSEISKLKNLKHLTFGSNEFTKLPPEIENLTNLVFLHLGYNKLAEFPEKILNLKKLVRLYLGGNKLTKLPSEIGNLKNLESLDLCNNKLKELPSKIGNLTKLVFFDLSNNELTTLPASFGNLTNLVVLLLENNSNLTLPKTMENLINLSMISGIEVMDTAHDGVMELSGRNLTSVPLGIVNRKINLNELNLSNNDLDCLPAFIVQLQELKKLDLRRNEKIDSIAKIDDAVFGIPSLKSIKLTVNNEDWEYNKDEIDKIRKERIKKVRKILQNVVQNSIDVKKIIKYLTIHKNGEKISKDEMKMHEKQDREFEEFAYTNTEKAYFFKILLTELESADVAAAKLEAAD